jgi:hypothetical protein
MSIQSTPFDRRAFLTGSALALGTGALTLLAGCGNTAPTSTTDTGSTAAPGSAADGGFSFIVGFDQNFHLMAILLMMFPTRALISIWQLRSAR